jgi:hypothetical protein
MCRLVAVNRAIQAFGAVTEVTARTAVELIRTSVGEQGAMS